MVADECDSGECPGKAVRGQQSITHTQNQRFLCMLVFHAQEIVILCALVSGDLAAVWFMAAPVFMGPIVKQTCDAVKYAVEKRQVSALDPCSRRVQSREVCGGAN